MKMKLAKMGFYLFASLSLLISCTKSTVKNNNTANTNNSDSSQSISLVKNVTQITSDSATGAIKDSSTWQYSYDGQDHCISIIHYTSSNTFAPNDTTNITYSGQTITVWEHAGTT